MSRQPKFRAWLPKAKKMTHAHTIPEWADIMRGLPKDEIVFLEFTGRVDIKGKEIFEGDVVIHVTETKRTTWQIVFRVDPEFVGFLPYEITFLQNKGYEPLSRFVRWDKMEIIGNIYKSPDLLAEDTKAPIRLNEETIRHSPEPLNH